MAWLRHSLSTWIEQNKVQITINLVINFQLQLFYINMALWCEVHWKKYVTLHRRFGTRKSGKCSGSWESRMELHFLKRKKSALSIFFLVRSQKFVLFDHSIIRSNCDSIYLSPLSPNCVTKSIKKWEKKMFLPNGILESWIFFCLVLFRFGRINKHWNRKFIKSVFDLTSFS